MPAVRLACLFLLVGCGGGGDVTGPSVTAVIIASHTAGIRVGHVVQLRAAAVTATGDTVPSALTWTSDDTSVAAVNGAGLVTGKKRGTTTIRAHAGAIAAASPIAVVIGVASITLPDSVRINAGATVQLQPVVLDSGGAPVSTLPDFTSDDVAKASVSSTGLVSGLGASDVLVHASLEGVTAQTRVVVIGPVVQVVVKPTPDTVVIGASVQLSASGRDAAGHQLPSGSVSWTSFHWRGAVTPGGLVTLGSAGPVDIVATATGSGLVGQALAVGVFDAGVTAVGPAAGKGCALTSAGSVYCWGTVVFAVPNLGSGNPPLTIGFAARLPTQLSGTSLVVGSEHACVLVAGGQAWCWGANTHGELGNDTLTQACTFGSCARAPVPVLGGLVFSALSLSRDFSCGVSTTGAGYCWGSDNLGALGNGAAGSSALPSAVAGGLTFRSIVAGEYHACGIAADSTAWCWGRNSHGQLGNGSVDSLDAAFAVAPGAVLGGRHFQALVAGTYYTCGLEGAGTVSCWGASLVSGQPGYLVQPATVPGASGFVQIAGGAGHVCGRNSTGQVLCWGSGNFGETGPNLPFGGLTPTLVPLTAAATALYAGGATSCARLATGIAMCWGEAPGGGGSGAGEAQPTQVPVRIEGQR